MTLASVLSVLSVTSGGGTGWSQRGRPGAPGPSTRPPCLPPAPARRHNDLPWQLLTSFNNQLLAPGANLTTLAHTHTNIPKLKAGLVGGQVRQWPLPLPVSGSALPPQILAKVRPLPGGSMSPSPMGPRVLGGVSDRPPGCGDGFEAGRGAGHTRPRAGGGPGA